MHSSPANTPSAPSNMPPAGTVSMCDPIKTAGPSWALGQRPRTFPASSTRLSPPASSMRWSSQRRAVSSASEKAGR